MRNRGKLIDIDCNNINLHDNNMKLSGKWFKYNIYDIH